MILNAVVHYFIHHISYSTWYTNMLFYHFQVKNFGRSGRTKYTHLVDQDTTEFDSPWTADTAQAIKFHNAKGGGMKQNFDRPTANKKRWFIS